MIRSEFYILPFHAFLIGKPKKGRCFRRTTFFSPQIKKTCLTRPQTKILGISVRQRNKLDFLSIFSKRHIFLHFKTTIFFCDFILQFWVSPILLSRALCLFFQVAIYNRPTGTFKPYSTPLWTIGFRRIQYKLNDGGHYSKKNIRKKNLGKNTKGTRSINRSKESRNVPQAGAFHPSINIWK